MVHILNTHKIYFCLQLLRYKSPPSKPKLGSGHTCQLFQLDLMSHVVFGKGSVLLTFSLDTNQVTTNVIVVSDTNIDLKYNALY